MGNVRGGRINQELGILVAQTEKASACNQGDLGSISGSGRFPSRREWLPTPVFLPAEFHGQRRLVGHSPWGCKELDTTEQIAPLHFHSYYYMHVLYSEAQTCLTVCKPMDCSPPGSSLHGVLQARILEWVAIS